MVTFAGATHSRPVQSGPIQLLVERELAPRFHQHLTSRDVAVARSRCDQATEAWFVPCEGVPVPYHAFIRSWVVNSSQTRRGVWRGWRAAAACRTLGCCGDGTGVVRIQGEPGIGKSRRLAVRGDDVRSGH